MRVTHVITGLNGGGAQFYMLRLLENISPAIRSEVISLTNKGVVGPQLEQLGIRVTALGMTPGTAMIGMRSLRRALLTSTPDIVHTWMYHSDLFAGSVARSAGLKSILWSVHHGNPTTAYDKPRTVLIARACALMSRIIPKRIVCASEATRDIHIALGYAPERMAVIPGGYDLAKFRPDAEAAAAVRTELRIPSEANVVGMVARFHELKGHTDFLKMTSLIHERSPQVHFVLLGRGVDSENAFLVDEIQARGLSEVTRLMGPRDDVHRVLASMDVLVSPSLAEAGPLVIGEAMACGVPCVGTDVGLTRSLIGDTGYITQPAHPDQSAAAVAEFLSLPTAQRTAQGAKARERITLHFSVQNTARQYEQLYESMVSDGRAPGDVR